MVLTYKDAVATLATTAVITISYAKLKGYDWPLLGSWRTATLVLLALGFMTCIFIGSNINSITGVWMNIAAALGVVAILLAFLGLVFDNKTFFILLSANIVALWVLTTIHHIVETGA